MEGSDQGARLGSGNASAITGCAKGSLGCGSRRQARKGRIVTYAQPSGAFTPIWVAHEAGLFKKTIGEYAKIEDARTIDGTYDAFAPYRALSLAVRPEAIRGQFSYLDEKEFPNAKTPTHETSTITRLSMR